jgi:hypothetical protein
MVVMSTSRLGVAFKLASVLGSIINLLVFRGSMLIPYLTENLLLSVVPFLGEFWPRTPGSFLIK